MVHAGCKFMNVSEIISTTLNGTRDSDKHLLTLFSLVISLNAKKVLELGTRNGTTAQALIEACKHTNGHLFSVDICQTSYKPPVEDSSYFTFIQSDAIDFLKKNNEFYDLIFIDDWHATEHVYNELILLKPYINLKTVILLHDLMHDNTEPLYNNTYHTGNEWEGTGPLGAVEKFVQENNNFEYATIPMCNGLTLLRKTGKVI